MVMTGRAAESASSEERPHMPSGELVAQAGASVGLCCWEFDSFWQEERENLSWPEP